MYNVIKTFLDSYLFNNIHSSESYCEVETETLLESQSKILLHELDEVPRKISVVVRTLLPRIPLDPTFFRTDSSQQSPTEGSGATYVNAC